MGRADSEDRKPSGECRAARVRRMLVPAALIACMVVVGFWEVMANWSRRPFDAFDAVPADFSGFVPGAAGWRAQIVPAKNYDPTALNLTSHRCHRAGAPPVIVRLVHGYNMPACMEIKGYKVESLPMPIGAADGVAAVQLWRLTSETDDVSIWSTAMLKGHELAPAGIDTRDMPFPRISTRDDPSWAFQGMTLQSLRHPIRNAKAFIRARWNSSRCDIWTFLRLRRHSWASNELYVLVARSDKVTVVADHEEAVIPAVLRAQHFMWQELHAWNQARGAVGEAE